MIGVVKVHAVGLVGVGHRQVAFGVEQVTGAVVDTAEPIPLLHVLGHALRELAGIGPHRAFLAGVPGAVRVDRSDPVALPAHACVGVHPGVLAVGRGDVAARNRMNLLPGTLKVALVDDELLLVGGAVIPADGHRMR